eukprot:GSChrysophyteH1.ASY1.ANO1.2567.1 assembled CDS
MFTREYHQSNVLGVSHPSTCRSHAQEFSTSSLFIDKITYVTSVLFTQLI